VAEVLRPVEKTIGRESDVVAVNRVDPGFSVESEIGGKNRRDRAESAQRNRDRHAGRIHQIEILPIVVKERVRIDIVRREHLSERVLEMMIEQVLPHIELGDAQIEIAPSGSGRGARARPQARLQRSKLCSDRPAILNDGLNRHDVWSAAKENLLPDVQREFLPDGIVIASQAVGVILAENALRSAD
jgi:hypothetical protein